MTEQQFWNMVNACETPEQVCEAESVLRSDLADDLDIDVWDDLMRSPAYISVEAYRQAR